MSRQPNPPIRGLRWAIEDRSEINAIRFWISQELHEPVASHVAAEGSGGSV